MLASGELRKVSQFHASALALRPRLNPSKHPKTAPPEQPTIVVTGLGVRKRCNIKDLKYRGDANLVHSGQLKMHGECVDQRLVIENIVC